jgi:predicted TIM-barrel fold metal-dependent hydrolase
VAPDLLIDFHAHYTPPALARGGSERTTEFVEGVPVFTHDASASEVDRRVEIMERAGIDAAYLSCGAGFHGSLEVCRQVNAGIAEARERHPERLFGLAQVPPLDGDAALGELEHAVSELGCRGVAIPAHIDGVTLDDPSLTEFFELVERLGLFVFVHAPLSSISLGRKPFDRYDLFRTVGREFELQLAVLRLILGGVLDRHAGLEVVVAHVGGGLGAVWPRVRGYQNKAWWGVGDDSRHRASSEQPVDAYLGRLFFDTAGLFGDLASVRAAITSFPADRIVLGSDYPQQLREEDDMVRLVASYQELREEIGPGSVPSGALASRPE